MDRNFLIALLLSFAVVSFWLQWQESLHGEARRLAREQQEEVARTESERPAEGVSPALLPAPETDLDVPAAEPPDEMAGGPPSAEMAQAERVHVTTDLYEVELSSLGGGITSWRLREYVDRTQGDEPVPVDLGPHGGPEPIGLFTPLTELGLGDLRYAEYAVEKRASQEVIFTLERGGLRIRKHYEFPGDSYAFRLQIELENAGEETVSPTFSVGWPARLRESSDFADPSLIALHGGSVVREAVSSLGKAGFFSREPSPPPRFEGDLEWAGADSRYFVAAIIPQAPRDALGAFVPVVAGEMAVAFVGYQAYPIAPGQSVTRELRGYVGPKEPERLEVLGVQLHRSVQLGWWFVAPLARLFNWLLHALYGLVPNYGVAIIIVTVLVKLVTAPLTNTSMKSMQRMAAMQPRMKEIQEKYADDRQRQSEEMMKLYRQSGANPLSGCLPMLLQFPFFIALYYALQSSIDLRQAYFFGWIHDLSVPEALFTIPGLDLPVRVLPLVMGASMVLSQRLTPSTMDPTQARMMMTVMPVMFTVLFYRFASGLVLYWLVNNLLQIGQQLYMNRARKREEAAASK